MKRFLGIILLLCLMLCACGKQEAPKQAADWVQLLPTQLLSQEEAQSFVPYSVQTTETVTRQKSTVVYQSVNRGEGDPIIVDVYQYNGRRSVPLVYQQFCEWREKRPSAKAVEGLSAEAFIAYPSMHLYTDGFHVVITAGSGSDDAQATLLQQIATPVLAHLEEFLSEHPTPTDIAVGLD